MYFFTYQIWIRAAFLQRKQNRPFLAGMFFFSISEHVLLPQRTVFLSICMHCIIPLKTSLGLNWETLSIYHETPEMPFWDIKQHTFWAFQRQIRGCNWNYVFHFRVFTSFRLDSRLFERGTSRTFVKWKTLLVQRPFYRSFQNILVNKKRPQAQRQSNFHNWNKKSAQNYFFTLMTLITIIKLSAS